MYFVCNMLSTVSSLTIPILLRIGLAGRAQGPNWTTLEKVERRPSLAEQTAEDKS
jgi:hypothetical protein